MRFLGKFKSLSLTTIVPLILAGVPVGCGGGSDGGPPTAPSASTVKDPGKFDPPPAEKKGRRTVKPGGAATNEP